MTSVNNQQVPEVGQVLRAEQAVVLKALSSVLEENKFNYKPDHKTKLNQDAACLVLMHTHLPTSYPEPSIVVMLRSMEVHLRHERLPDNISSALNAMSVVTNENKENIKFLGNSRKSLEVILQAMHKHESDASIQNEGVLLLAKIMGTCEGIQARMLECGSIQVLTSVLDVNTRQGPLAKDDFIVGCMAHIATLLSYCNGIPFYPDKINAFSKQVIPTVLNAMSTRVKDKKVHKWGTSCLFKCILADDFQELMKKGNGIQIMVRMLNSDIDTPEMDLVITALMHAAKGHRQNQDSCVKEGVIVLVCVCVYI